MMHRLDESAAAQCSQLPPVQGIGLVAASGDQGIAVRVAHDHLVHMRREIPIQPVRQRAFLDHQFSGAGNRLDGFNELGDARGRLPSLPFASRIVDVASFAKAAVHIKRDKIHPSHKSLPAEWAISVGETAYRTWPRTSYIFRRKKRGRARKVLEYVPKCLKMPRSGAYERG